MRHLDDGQLQAWLDGPRAGLDAEARTSTARHLEDCPDCARRLATLRNESERAAGLLGTPMVGDLPPFEAIVARADAAEDLPDSRRPLRRWRATGWAASILVAAGAGWIANDLFRPAPGDLARPAPMRTDETPAPDLESPGIAANDTDDADAAAGGGAPAPEAAAEAEAVPPPSPPPAAPVEGARMRPAQESARGADARAAAKAGAAAISGRVVDAGSGRPLESAQVYVPELQAGAFTDTQGRYFLLLDTAGTGIPADSLSLSVELIGYGGQSRPLTASGSETAEADFRLESTALRLQELVVTGAPADAASADSAPAPPTARRTEPPSLALPFAALDVDAAGWTPVSKTVADARLGTPVPVVPDLEVERVDGGLVDGVPLIRVIQRLDDGARLTLFAALRSLALAGPPPGGEAISAQVGDVWIVAVAPRSPDQLRALLDRLR